MANATNTNIEANNTTIAEGKTMNNNATKGEGNVSNNNVKQEKEMIKLVFIGCGDFEPNSRRIKAACKFVGLWARAEIAAGKKPVYVKDLGKLNRAIARRARGGKWLTAAEAKGLQCKTRVIVLGAAGKRDWPIVNAAKKAGIPVTFVGWKKLQQKLESVSAGAEPKAEQPKVEKETPKEFNEPQVKAKDYEDEDFVEPGEIQYQELLKEREKVKASLEASTVKELKKKAAELEVPYRSYLRKEELINAILVASAWGVREEIEKEFERIEEAERSSRRRREMNKYDKQVREESQKRAQEEIQKKIEEEAKKEAEALKVKNPADPKVDEKGVISF